MEPTKHSAALRFVILIGLVSLFADVAYEGAHGINGQFLESLGASATVVGAVAGLGELFAYGLRFFSGRWADRTRAYWPIAILGYCINLLAVPAMALAGHPLVAAALILLERAGKAIRNPARDAMLSHASHRVGPGWAFGLHEALDETGAALGPLAAAAILALHGGFRLAYGALLVPALLALGLLLRARKTNPRPTELEPASPAGSLAFDRRFWLFVAGGACVGAGFADFSLVAFRLTRDGLFATAAIPALYALANALNAGGSLALGRAFDRHGPALLALAIVPPVASTPLLFLGSAPLVVAGIVLWALGVTVQQGLFKAMLARLAPADRRAIAFGTFDGVWGVASFGGGLLLGALYDRGVGGLVIASVALQLLAVPFVLAVTRRVRG
jgi:hypothetical protein